MRAALLACGEEAVISHATAAALLRLRDREPTLVDVIAHGQSGRKIDGIRRHHVPSPTGAEVVVCDGIATTSPARTIVDLAGSVGRLSLREMIERAAVGGMLNIPAMDAAASPRRRGHLILQDVLSDWRDDAMRSPRLRSTLEARLLALIEAHEIPRPHCNQVVMADGSKYEVDLLWREQRLVIETDGHAFHGNRLAFERDRRRDRDLASAGYRVVRVTWIQVEKEAAAIMATIRRLLE